MKRSPPGSPGFCRSGVGPRPCPGLQRRLEGGGRLPLRYYSDRAPHSPLAHSRNASPSPWWRHPRRSSTWPPWRAALRLAGVVHHPAAWPTVPWLGRLCNGCPSCAARGGQATGPTSTSSVSPAEDVLITPRCPSVPSASSSTPSSTAGPTAWFVSRARSHPLPLLLPHALAPASAGSQRAVETPAAPALRPAAPVEELAPPGCPLFASKYPRAANPGRHLKTWKHMCLLGRYPHDTTHPVRQVFERYTTGTRRAPGAFGTFRPAPASGRSPWAARKRPCPASGPRVGWIAGLPAT